MSLTDVGLQFKMIGADSFESKLNSMKSAYDSLSSSTGKGVDMSPHLQKMTGHLDAAHNKISGFFKLTEGAILAFLAGSAVKGLANWITGGQGGRDIDKMKDFIRYKGADKAYMDAVGDKMKELSQRRPFDTQDAWNAQEQILSMVGPQKSALGARATEAAANLGYALGGPKGSSNAAMDFARPGIAAWGQKLDPDGKVALLEKMGGLLKYITDTTQTKGHDIELIFQQIASLYANTGKSIEQAFVDSGILGGALGGQGGEVLKNIISKQGTSYGKFMAEADYQNKLAGIMRANPNIKSEADLPKEYRGKLNEAKSLAEKAYAAEGGRLGASGNIRQLMSNIMQGKELLESVYGITGKDPTGVLSEIFGETAIKGISMYQEAIASGTQERMIAEAKSVKPSGLTEQIDTQQQSLGSKADTLDQAVAGLSKEFRRIFEPAAVGIIDEAKNAFVGMRSQLDTLNKEGGLAKNMKEYVAGAIGGYRNVGTDQEGPQKSFDEIFKEFAQGLAGGGWAESGQKLGTAIGEFASAATKFAELIGLLHAPIAGFQAAKKYIESWFPQTDPKDASASEKATGTLGSLGVANLARKAVGWKTGLMTYLFGGTDKEPWQMLGNMATWAGIGSVIPGVGPFAGAAGGWAAHQVGKMKAPEAGWQPEGIFPTASEILRANRQDTAPAPKPEVTNEVEANIDEERLTDWLTIKIKTILKGLGGQQDQSWQNSQDWGAGGTSGP
jgi:hypothetical protein